MELLPAAVNRAYTLCKMIIQTDKRRAEAIAGRLGSYTTRYACLMVLMLLPLASSGCVTATLVTAGTVIGAASSAVSTGADVYRLGKLDTAVMATYNDSREAVREATANFRLKVVWDEQEGKHKNIWSFRLADDLKETVDITIEQRSEMLCLIRVDVGWFGSQPTAQLLIDKIRTHLSANAAPIVKT
jgi:Protein of unknown function (DUF3568)